MKRCLLFLALILSSLGSVSAATRGSYTLISSNALIDINGVAITNTGGGLAFDGTNLWYTAYRGTNSMLYCIDPSNQAVTGQWLLPFEAHGIAWDGSQLRIADTKNEPRIRSYDRQGNLLGSQLVEAETSMFQGLAWDGSRLWGADDWLLLQFDATGALARVHSSSWISPYTVLTWNGSNLVAALGGGDRIVNIDALTGNFSGYQTWVVVGGSCKIATGGGRMWFVNNNGLSTQIYEVVVPGPAPLPPLATSWGAFPLFDGFAVPQRSGFFTGAGLGAWGADYWYCDAFNVSKVGWSNRTVNTAALDLDWPIAGGANDVATDGTRVWLLDVLPVVYELNMNGSVITNFGLPDSFSNDRSGIAWDGEALWIGGTKNTAKGWVSSFSRFTPNGRLLFGPVVVGAGEVNFWIDDMTWHNGKLWLNQYTYLTSETISCVDPASGTIIGRYRTGGQRDGYSGLASDGTNLFAAGFPAFQGDVSPLLGTWILRLGMPTNMIPPRLIGATSTTNAITNTITCVFDKPIGNYLQSFNFTNCIIESPSGTPLFPTAPSFVYPTSNQIVLTKLPLPVGNSWRVIFHGIRDTTGNMLREDGTGNVISGIMGGLTAPAGLAVTALTTNQNVISWRDASAGETGFRVERRLGATGTWEQVADIPTTNSAGLGGVMSYTNSNVNGDYTYRVYAYNAGNSPYSDAQTASQTNLPFAVRGVAGSTDGNFTVRWNGETGMTYRVVRSTSPGFETFDVVLTGIAGASPVNTLVDPTPRALGLTNVFYRIERE